MWSFFYGYCRRVLREIIGDDELFIVPPEEVCGYCWEEKCFRFNHKIMMKVQESPPSIMVTRNLWSA